MQFTFLFPDFDRSTDAVARSQIASDLRASVLYGIRIDTRGGDDTTILMDYLEQARRKLSRLVWRSGLVNIETTYLQGGGVMYPRYSIPDETSGIDMPEYRFSYDPGRMPHGYILPQADRWGYWNGLCHSLGSYPSELPSSVNATRSESLTGITYPTGGKSIFEYEGNDYSKIEDDNHGLIDVSGMSGGLRVRSVTNVSRDDRIVSKKAYHYRQTMDSPSLSSGISRLQDPTTVTYGMKIPLAQPLPGGTAADSLYVSLTMSGMYGFGLPVTNMNTPDTGYSCVIEETLDEEGNSLGYVVNRFSNFDTDIHGQTHADTVAYHHHNHMRTGPGIPYTSNSSERGKLMSRTWCKGDGTEVKSEVYRYARINDRNIPTATQRTVFINSDPAYLIQLSMAWLTSTNTSSYMLVSTTVREGDYSDSTWTCYNQRRQPTSESVLASDGTRRTVCYTYAEDHPQQYGWMVDSHILSPVVTTCLSCGDLCRTTVNTYSDAGNGSGHIPYVSKMETVHGEDGPAETDYEVVSTDRWGNPTEIIRNGVHSVLQWSRNGQCLRTVAENMTLSEYEALPEFISHAQTQSDDTEEYPFIMDPAERDASGLYVWNYNYDARLNLVRMTSPEGLMSYYSYDVLGRLAEEKVVEETGNGDFEIKTVKKYSYHYQKD